MIANRSSNRIVIVNSRFYSATKAKSREPAYSKTLKFNQNKIDRQRVNIQRVRQAKSQTAMVDGVWS